MKIQDIVFIVVLLVLLVIVKKPKWLAMSGLICLVLSIPLFASWVFFTAQRLTYYAAAFFTTAILFYLNLKRGKE